MSSEIPGGERETEAIGSTDLGRGATVGRYLIIGLVGKGGMGEVYAAYDPELDRKVALKLLRTQTTAGVDASEGRARLLREAQAIARLSDPNVVVVFDVGTFDNRVFLAMEFIDGHTLGYWIHSEPRTWRDILTKFAAAGRGLAAAHRAGVVHRDFKPENVMIGDDGKVRVMDFGLARTIEPDAAPAPAAGQAASSATTTAATTLTGFGMSQRSSRVSRVSRVSRAMHAGEDVAGAGAAQEAVDAPAHLQSPRAFTGAESRALESVALASGGQRDSPTRNLFIDALGPGPKSRLTDSGAMMGTPAYMSPEQFEGGAIDARADQFSFCVTLYEALYGERPFAGRSIAELTSNMRHGRVREASVHSRVPGWVRRVVLKGLRAQATDRYASMDALLEQLARDPASTRLRWATGAAVSALILALGAGLVSLERQQRLRCTGYDAKLAGVWELPAADARLSPRKSAIHSAFLTTGKRYAEQSFTQVMKTLDRYVMDLNAMHQDACEATNMRGEQSAEVLDLRVSCLHERFSELRALTEIFGGANGDVVSRSVEAAAALRPVDQCADVAALRAVVRPPDDPVVRATVAAVRTELAGARALHIAGKYKQLSAQLPMILEKARRTGYAPIIAETLLELGRTEMDNVDPTKAETTLEEAVWTAEAARHDEVLVEAVTDLIYNAGYLQGRYTDGERWGQYANAVLKRLGPGHDVLAGWRANNLGVMYEKQGRPEQSLAVNLEAVMLKTRALGATHFDVALSELNVALADFELGRIDQAIALNERAMNTLTTALGPEHPQVAIGLLNAAEALNAKGRYEDALDMGTRAGAIWERESGPDHLLLAYAFTSMGQSLLGTHRAPLAVRYLERALRIRETRDPNPELLAETQFALARGLWDANRGSEKAVALAKQARANYRGTLSAIDKKAEVDRWIEAHDTGSEHVSVRLRSGRTRDANQRVRITDAL